MGWQPAEQTLHIGGKTWTYYALAAVEKQGLGTIDHLPYCLRILGESLLRRFDGRIVTEVHIERLFQWKGHSTGEIPFYPARILMQDFTGVPAVVDLASLREALAKKGVDPLTVNPQIPVDLVIDHSIQADFFGSRLAYRLNIQLEYQRNRERYQLLKWAQQAFRNFRVIPPGMGIVHQVNLEYLAQVVTARDGVLFPDTLLGTDSHTPMVNGIGVVGWGVGGIEAEAALLGQPVYYPVPEVVGLRLTGTLPEGVTTTDLVLTITHLLRQVGVVGKFVEVTGPALATLSIPERATIANMSPEFGCTITYFPIDQQTLDYLRLTGRPPELIERVEVYTKENGLWRQETTEPQYTQVVELDLSTVEPVTAGPRRPHDKLRFHELPRVVDKEIQRLRPNRPPEEDAHTDVWQAEGGGSSSGGTVPGGGAAVQTLATESAVADPALKQSRLPVRQVTIRRGNVQFTVGDGAVVLAAITSCTNTSNPYVLLGAGLVAKKAVERGLRVPPWVKTVFAPGSRVVTKYLEESGLMPYLEALGFHIVGYGCTVCIGNSGSLLPEVEQAIREHDLITASVLSGNRNFEARIHSLVRMNFLMSPPMVVAYALAGTIRKNILEEPVGVDPAGQPVYLKDIWYTSEEVQALLKQILKPEDFQQVYARIEEGDEFWQKLDAPSGTLYQWDPQSTYIRRAPFFDVPDEPSPPQDIENARVLLKLGDTVTTDHISPAGRIPVDSPAGKYLLEHGVEPHQFNTYGSRRGNHEVMVRGTFANVRLRNLLVNREGGWTRHFPEGTLMTVYECAMRYQEEGIPLIVLAGKEYGTGSSRDWAAKGTRLLGIRAVLAESFERIHRANLVGMGVLPLQFREGDSWQSLNLEGDERYTIRGLTPQLQPQQELIVYVEPPENSGRKSFSFPVIARLDTPVEVEYFLHGGILPYVYREFLRRHRAQKQPSG